MSSGFLAYLLISISNKIADMLETAVKPAEQVEEKT